MAGVVLVPALAWGQPARPDDRRPIFNLKALQAVRFEVDSRSDMVGIGAGFQLVILSHAIRDGEGKGLDRISRVFVLQGDRVEFDSFLWDGVGDAVEPGIASKTFFAVRTKMVKGVRARAPYLVLSGTVPIQNPGEPIRISNRMLVLSWTAEQGFKTALDVTSDAPPVLSGASVRVDL
jgi:hypothetical protein